MQQWQAPQLWHKKETGDRGEWQATWLGLYLQGRAHQRGCRCSSGPAPAGPEGALCEGVQFTGQVIISLDPPS